MTKIEQMKNEMAEAYKSQGLQNSWRINYCSGFTAAQQFYQPIVEELVEALEMGAFHHNACPWLRGKECCCANQKVKQALISVRKKLE